jgi:ubiquinone/menaquinone biosynthesis C-methylase UbiE
MHGSSDKPVSPPRGLDRAMFFHEIKRKIMNLELRTLKTPAEMYEHFFVPAIFEPLARLTVEAAQVEPGQRALDLACGTGVVTRLLAPRLGPTGSIVGLDLRPGMLEVARARGNMAGAPVDWRQGDAVTLELADASFDRVVCQQGLQFFADRRAALAEITRVLEPAGRLTLAVWLGREHHDFFESMAAIELEHLPRVGMSEEDQWLPFALGNQEQLRQLMEEAGLRQITIGQVSLTVSFPAADFVRNVEFGYAAVVPEFAENPQAFESFVERVSRDSQPLLDRYRQGERIEFRMHTHIATGIR